LQLLVEAAGIDPRTKVSTIWLNLNASDPQALQRTLEWPRQLLVGHALAQIAEHLRAEARISLRVRHTRGATGRRGIYIGATLRLFEMLDLRHMPCRLSELEC
jgi:hypothetical protein